MSVAKERGLDDLKAEVKTAQKELYELIVENAVLLEQLTKGNLTAKEYGDIKKKLGDVRKKAKAIAETHSPERIKSQLAEIQKALKLDSSPQREGNSASQGLRS
jgi:hypothetical protein